MAEDHAPCESSTSSLDSSASLVYLAVESQTTAGTRQCRVCWDVGEPRTLIAPCACKGTQKYIHVKCLRKWQENVQRRDFRDERAYRCGVCRKTYSLAPSNPRWTTKLWHVVRGLIGATCVSLLAFGLAGPPWPHLALLALVILGSRSHGLLAVALLTAGTMVALLHAKGMRLMMHIDDTGRLGLTVVRHGLPIPGVGAGTILVATDELDRSVFRRSVVYIYQHSTSMGSSGVILNQPMHGPPSGGVASNNASIANKTNKTVHPSQNNQKTASPQHFLGGPVGMPGEGARQEIIVLHTVPGVEGAVPLQLPPSASSIKIYMGGRLGDVLELVHESPFKCPSINVYHGISTWAEGQLEGEIRAGAWAYGQGIGDDIISGDTTNLWSSLLTSNRLTWLA